MNSKNYQNHRTFPKAVQLGIIGNGRMGSAIHNGVSSRGVSFIPSVTDRTDPDATASLVAKNADMIVLATKPFTIHEVAEEIGGHADGKVVISLLAGIRSEILETCFPQSVIVRTMPTIMARMGESTTGWWTNEEGSIHEPRIRELLATFGTGVRLEKEEHLDVFTACIGSGPAFLCRMQECLQELMPRVAMTEDMRALIESPWKYLHTVWEDVLSTCIEDASTCYGTVQHMFEGTNRMWKRGTTPTELREAITTPKGTTAAGLMVWEREEIDRLCAEVVHEVAEYAVNKKALEHPIRLEELSQKTNRSFDHGYTFVWHKSGLGAKIRAVLQAATQRAQELGTLTR